MGLPLQELTCSVRAAKHGQTLTQSLTHYFRELDKAVAEVSEISEAKLACRDGCSLCCYLRVHVRAHEVFAILDYIRKKFTISECSLLRARLIRHSETIAKMTEMEHKTTNVPCPLLIDSRCSIYPVRPLGCRSHHSLSLKDCEYSFNNPKDIVFSGAKSSDILAIVTEMGNGAHELFAEAGYDDTIYELGMALLSGLENPASVKRWRDGKNPLLKGKAENQ